MRMGVFIILTGIFLLVVPNVTASDNSCIDCHKTISPFIEIQKQFNQIRVEHLEKNVVCSLECHEDRVRQLATANYQQWSESVHALKGVTCEVCHGGNPKVEDKAGAHKNMVQRTDTESPVYYTNVPDTCGKCHAEEMEHFKNTMHYQRLKAESRAPSCVTCHRPHTFKVLKASEMTALCSVCHNPRDQIATASVPIGARNALEKQKEFQDELLIAKKSIASDKAARKDVTRAQIDM
ncbi:MAG: ammonia-forming cytochrome c nitrite reductase subunit c552, partial [Euryarchaeota archaeon]|nr:ammonia-forming cytochrome c nitrite reductase subunit c552 [Euryarchaeota archaeon]